MNFLKISKWLVRSSPCINGHPNKFLVRTLFSSETLGLTTYQKNRQDAEINVEGKESFKWELKCYLQNVKEPDVTNIKNAVEVLVHLIQPTADDIDLLKTSLYSMNSCETLSDKAKSSIGNLVMKSLHTINMVDAATEFYTDQNLVNFFDGFKCTHLYLDLLYKNEKYEEIIHIDRHIRQELKMKRTNFSKYLDVVVLGACYNLNTAQSFDYANRIWEDLRETSQFKKSVVFMGALALKQQKPSIALVVLQVLDRYFISEQLKMLAMADLQFFNEIFDALKLWLSDDGLSARKISKDVLDRLHRTIDEYGSEEQQRRFVLLYDKLIESSYVTDQSLDELLNKTMSPKVSVRGKRSNTNEDDSQMELFSDYR